MPRLLIAAMLAVSVCLASAGCDSTGKGMVAVSGSVKYSDDQPVTGEMATIVFQPDSANPTAKSASGTIQSDGSFVLMTSKPDDGAYPGDYKVILKVWSNYREQKLAVPKEFSEASTTPLTATIDKSNHEFDFTIDR